jgi:sugar phosphate isomerase/epimerase
MVSTNIAGNAAAQAQNVATIQAAAAMAHEVQPKRPPPIQVQFGAGKPDQWDALREQTAARLRELVSAAADGGTSIVLGSHAGALVNRPERLLWLYQQAKSPALALYYNHIHSSLEGVPLEESWRMLGAVSKFIHLQDATGDAANKNYLLPGDGPTDFPKYFRLVRTSGYRGPVVVHISGKFSTAPGYQPIPVAEKCHAAMADALKKSLT